MRGFHVRVRPEVERLVRRVSEEYGLTTDTVRNLSILLGLPQLLVLLKSSPSTQFLKELYNALLRGLGGLGEEHD